MWKRISDIASTAASMIQSGKAPPNTPPEYIEELKATNFLRSKKFFVVFSSVVMVLAFFSLSVFILFLTAPIPSITTPFVTIFVETLKVLTIVIASYLGLQTILDFKYDTNSIIETEGQIETVIENLTHNIKEDDYNISEDSI